jgi:hypothetical protein
MYIGSKNNLHKITDDIPVMLNGQPFPRVHSISCGLGVTLDGLLRWDEHIETICKKVGACAGVGTLKRIKSYIPANMLQSIYSALIQPYIFRLLLSTLGHL